MGPIGAGTPVGPVRFLVPWRTDHGDRERLWAFCRARWAKLFPTVEIAEADAPAEEFSRARAINEAAKGEWNIGVVLDADVFADATQVTEAIEHAAATGRLTLGFSRYLALTPSMTRRVLDGFGGPFERGVRYRSNVHESSIVAVRRDLFDELAGFDQRFSGWGQEDVAFAHAARVLRDGIDRVPGDVFHLWHGRAEARNPRRGSYQRAQKLGARYREITTREAMRALLDERADAMDAGSIERARAFSRIYRLNHWNGRETRSGPGSGTEATELLVRWLPKICADLGVGTVLDAGCGEGTWQPELPGYVGIDIVEAAIAVARRIHPQRQYGLADICSDTLPETDAVLCRDALQHLSLHDGLAAIANFRRSGARYLIASSHDGERNTDTPAGGWYASNLQAEPFNFGKPIASVFDGRWENADRYPMKIVGVWPLQ